MANAAVLAVEVQANVSKAAAEVESFGASAVAMAADVDKASRTAQQASTRIDAVGESADNLDSKASQATGSLGALAAGFELAGATKHAETLNQAAMATDFLSGVGSGLNLILNLNALATVRAKAATMASTAATKAAAAGQWALNAALSANPIGLLILAIVAAVALFVVLYRRSDSFRSLVQKVGRTGKAALDLIVGGAKDVASWIGDNVPRQVGRFRDTAVAAFRLVTTPQRTLLTVIKDVAKFVGTNLPAGFTKAKDKAVEIASAMLSPFRTLQDLVDNVLGLIDNIKIPDLSALPGLRVALPGGGSVVTAGSSSGGGDTINIRMDGIHTDPDATARQLLELINRSRARRGLPPL